MALEPRRRNDPFQIGRLARWVVPLLLILAGIGLVPPWIMAWWTGLANSPRRALAIGFLNGCLIAYGVIFFAAIIAGISAFFRLLQGRKLRQKRSTSARILLLSSAILIALAFVEMGSWALIVRARMPPPHPPIPPPHVPIETGRSNELRLLVLGESSAEGQPFQPWFSIGHVLAWQLEKAHPGRKVNLIMAAEGGISLTSVVRSLEQQTYRPDVVLLYSGHNEFQTRWGWSRTVHYYPEDLRTRPADGFTEWVGDVTPFTRMIHAAVDRQKIDLPPIVKEDRDVVDRPVCDLAAREEVRATFARELETVASWCEKAGAVPIFIVPAGNDVGFDPDRSILDVSTRLSDRESFAARFFETKNREISDPIGAITDYRRLIAGQPLFAEAHYRLARLLLAKGHLEEAGREFETARDLDGLPMRCPSEIQSLYREISAKHKTTVLVDGPSVLRRLSPSGLLDDHTFHDGQHPTFRAYLALAQNALDQLRNRSLFDLDKTSQPQIDPTECASKFDLDRPDRWALVCRRSANFWSKLASGRYDPSDRFARADRLTRAAERIELGTKPEDAGVPGLGVRPKGFP